MHGTASIFRCARLGFPRAVQASAPSSDEGQAHGLVGNVGRRTHGLRIAFGHSDSESVILGPCPFGRMTPGLTLLRDACSVWALGSVYRPYNTRGKLCARMPAVDTVNLDP